jgi:ring-1,2-phenylacetyl-CoA epoxidase subunit PaaC
MEEDLKAALQEYLISIADDELILAHRNSEWCGHAPIIEEDIAFANIALDEMGHAAVWYMMIADLLGKDTATYPDQLIFRRHPRDYRNIQMVELPKGDWAFSILRQYLFDLMEKIRLEAFLQSNFTPISLAAAKIGQEEKYHLRHTSLWVKRLAMGTEESHKRMQDALDELWGYAFQMFQPVEQDAYLRTEGITLDFNLLREEWRGQVSTYLKDCGLVIPMKSEFSIDRKHHTHHLQILLAEMQSVAMSDPQAGW